jgi:NAD(P)-dependent dehydrogenase (short-subunit alcohol dehydrogenase family)|eukprot:COSAG01_NODE_27471_length_684_cov_504.888889_1_plen_94_part_00
MEGKVVVVTGGAFGIGRAITLGCAAAGARAVVVADLPAEHAYGERTAADAQAQAHTGDREGCDAMFVGCDVSRGSDVAELMRRTAAAYGAIDV